MTFEDALKEAHARCGPHASLDKVVETFCQVTWEKGLMADYLTCKECGERYENGPSTHECPGSLEDRVAALEQAPRIVGLDVEARDQIDQLQRANRELRARVADLGNRLDEVIELRVEPLERIVDELRRRVEALEALLVP